MPARRWRSKIPPQALYSLERMTESERKIRASELLGSYEGKAAKLHKIAERMAEDWIQSQSDFLGEVSSELREIVATGDLPAFA